MDFDTTSLSPENALPAQLLKYRAQIASGQAKTVLDSVSKESQPECVAVKALAYYSIGKADQAQQEVDRLLEASSDDPTVQVLGGTILQALGRPEDALGLLSKHQGNLEAFVYLSLHHGSGNVKSDTLSHSIALIVQIHLQQNRTDLALKEVTAARNWAQDNLLVNIAESWVGLRVVRKHTSYQSTMIIQETNTSFSQGRRKVSASLLRL